MCAANWIVIGLTVVGSVTEFFGIVIVAGRMNDLKRPSRAAWRTVQERQRLGTAQLRSMIPPPRAIPGVPVVVKVAAADSFALGGEVGVSSTISWSVRDANLDHRVSRLEDQYGLLRDRSVVEQERVDALVNALRQEVPELVKDPWHGLALLGVGLLCLTAAGIIGAATSCPTLTGIPR